MKKQIFIMVVFFTAINAARLIQQPAFENDGSIAMSANGGMCGGVTLKPVAGQEVKVMAKRFEDSNWVGQPLSDWIVLPDVGLRVGYDWGGPSPSYHYRVFCQKKTQQGDWVDSECKNLVTLDEPLHNRPCIAGIHGAQASYEPLNMKVESEKK